MPFSTAWLPPDSSPEELLEAILDVSLTGINLLRPLYGPSGELEDFALEYLNPAAQRMTGLAERPAGTLCSHFPNTRTAGVLDYYRQVFQTGQPGQRGFNYQADGLDNYFRLAARRSGEWLVVSLTDTSDQDRSAVEVALRQSQAAEKAARAQAEAERGRLHQVLMRMPASIALLRGPEHVYELVNSAYERHFPARTILGRSIRQVIPELEGQGFYELLDRVYQTGESYYADEVEAQADFSGTGQLERRYYRTCFEPIRNAQGLVEEVLNFAVDVTLQVESRQQVERLNQQLIAANEELSASNEELAAANEELRVASEEIQAGHEALLQAKQALEHLNQALEERVEIGTQQLHKAQAQAEQERQLLESVLTQAPVAIGVFQGDELVVTQANDRLCAMWGYKPAQVLGKPLLEGVPELDGQGFDALIREVGRTRVPFVGTEAPAVLRGDDGRLETHYFNFVYQPLYGPDGGMLGVLDIAADVTEQVRSRHQAQALQAQLLAAAQRQVQEKETFYQVFEQTPASIVLLRGPEHRVEYLNQAYQQLFPGRQMRGRTIADIQPDAAEQGFVALLDGVFHSGETFFGRELQLGIDQPDGTRKETYFNFTYQAYRENDQVTGVSVFAYDVTEQVLARRQEERSREMLQLALEAGQMGTWLLDLQEDTSQRSLKHDQLYGYASFVPTWGYEQFIAHVLPQDRPAVAGCFQEARQTGKLHFEARIVRVDGDLRWIEVRGEVFYDSANQPLRMAGVVTDITERKLGQQQLQVLNEELATTSEELAAANEELRAANEEIQSTNEELTESNGQLLRTNKDLDNFIYTASHDLKAPISNIEGLLQALLRTLSPESLATERTQRITALMQDSVERFKKTINSLTEVVKLQKEHNGEAGLVDLHKVVGEVSLDLASMISDSGAQLQVELSDCPAFRFSEKNLRSVVYNLLSNAIKYRSPERTPRVYIHCQSTPVYYVLSVADNGLGMEPSLISQLFTMFKRFHDHVEGTGIGLYMVKKMVENAGGYIEVESQVNVGSTFRVYFSR